MENKGALRTIAKEYAGEIREGIAWVAVWKTGRSWHAETVWLDPATDLLRPEDLATVRKILGQDPDAVMINGYYCGHLGGDMTINELAAGIRWHYEGGCNLLAGSAVFPEDEDTDGKTGLIKRMQEELHHRTDVEERAVRLICEGKHEAAMELLGSLDDSLITGMSENMDGQRAGTRGGGRCMEYAGRERIPGSGVTVQPADIQMAECLPQNSTQKDPLERGGFEEFIGRPVADEDYEAAEMAYLFHPAFRTMSRKEFAEFYRSSGRETFHHLHPEVKEYRDLVSRLRYTHEAIGRVERELAQLRQEEAELKELKQKMRDVPGAFEDHARITYRVDASGEKKEAAANSPSPPHFCGSVQHGHYVRKRRRGLYAKKRV